MKTRREILTLATVALVLTFSFASVAFAHGGVADGHEAGQLSGFGWVVTYLPPVFALGGLALVGFVYYATRRRG
jgi:hypothetical protein